MLTRQTPSIKDRLISFHDCRDTAEILGCKGLKARKNWGKLVEGSHYAIVCKRGRARGRVRGAGKKRGDSRPNFRPSKISWGEQHSEGC